MIRNTPLSGYAAAAALLVAGGALAGCNEPEAALSAALDTPTDVVVTDFCLLACQRPDDDGATRLSFEAASRATCDLEAPCGEGVDGVGVARSFAVVANAGDHQLHVLDIDLAEPSFRDYNGGIPGVTGLPVGADPRLLALHHDAARVWVVSSGLSTDPSVATATPELAVVDVLFGDPVGFDPLALSEVPAAIAPLPGVPELALAMPGSRSLAVAGLDDRGLLALRTTIDLGRSPTQVVVGADGLAYVAYRDQAHIDIVDLSGACRDDACVLGTLEGPEDARIGPLSYVPALVDPAAPELLLAVDDTDSQVLVFDLADRALVDVNANNGLRDLPGVGIGSRLITDITAWATTTSASQEISVAGVTVEGTTVQRRAAVTTTSGVGHIVDIDHTELFTVADTGAEDATLVYERYVPALHRLDGDGSTAGLLTLGCEHPDGSPLSAEDCTSTRLPRLRPVDCDLIAEDDAGYGDPDAYIGICADPIASTECPEADSTDTDEAAEEVLGGCCVAAGCEAEAVTRDACLTLGGVFSEAMCDATWCGEQTLASAPTCGWEPAVNTDDGGITLFAAPVDINVASDTWHLVWDTEIPGTERSDGLLSLEDDDAVWVHFGLMQGCDSPETFCEVALRTDCALAEDLCDAEVDLCDGTHDLCERCPELCPEDDLCTWGVTPSVDATAGDTLVVHFMDAVEGERRDLCTDFIGDEDADGIAYPIVEVLATGVRLGAADGAPPLGVLIACFGLEGTGAAPAMTTHIEAADQWLLYGERLGVESPYERDGDMCVVATEAFAQDSRPVEGERFDSRWGFHFLLDPGVDSGAATEVPSGFEIYFRTDSQFGGRTITTGASPSGIQYADAYYGPRLIVTDSGSSIALVYSASTFRTVTDPIP